MSKKKKVLMFKKDYWLNAVEEAKPSERLEVAVDFMTNFILHFSEYKEYTHSIMNQYYGQAMKIFNRKFDFGDNYTLYKNWFPMIFAQMVIVSHKHSRDYGRVSILSPLSKIFNAREWDLSEATTDIDNHDYFLSLVAVEFVAGNNETGKEIYDTVRFPMYEMNQFTHGTKWQMKNGKIWTSHGEDHDKVILFRDDENGNYQEKRFSKERVLKMTRVDKFRNL